MEEDVRKNKIKNLCWLGARRVEGWSAAVANPPRCVCGGEMRGRDTRRGSAASKIGRPVTSGRTEVLAAGGSRGADERRGFAGCRRKSQSG